MGLLFVSALVCVCVCVEAHPANRHHGRGQRHHRIHRHQNIKQLEFTTSKGPKIAAGQWVLDTTQIEEYMKGENIDCTSGGQTYVKRREQVSECDKTIDALPLFGSAVPEFDYSLQASELPSSLPGSAHNSPLPSQPGSAHGSPPGSGRESGVGGDLLEALASKLSMLDHDGDSMGSPPGSARGSPPGSARGSPPESDKENSGLLAALASKLSMLDSKDAKDSKSGPSDEYKVGDHLGAGGVGDVYICMVDSKPMAVKYIKNKNSKYPLTEDMLFGEVKKQDIVAGQKMGPQVHHVHNIVDTDGKTAGGIIVMDIVRSDMLSPLDQLNKQCERCWHDFPTTRGEECIEATVVLGSDRAYGFWHINQLVDMYHAAVGLDAIGMVQSDLHSGNVFMSSWDTSIGAPPVRSTEIQFIDFDMSTGERYGKEKLFHKVMFELMGVKLKNLKLVEYAVFGPPQLDTSSGLAIAPASGQADKLIAAATAIENTR